MSTLQQYIALLESADDTISAEAAARLRQASAFLTTYAQHIAHRKTGLMADSMHYLGPFAIGNGILESQIQSGAPYAVQEIKRGGEHDWASRTLKDNDAVLTALANELGVFVVTEIVGT